LAAKLKEINAAKDAQKTVEKDAITAQEKLTSAQDMLTVLQETRDTQKELVSQMLEIMQAQIASQNAAKAAAGGAGGAGAGAADLAGILGKVGKVDLATTMSKAIDDAKAKILASLNTLWTAMKTSVSTAMGPFVAPLTAAWNRLQPLLAQALTSVQTWAAGWGDRFKRFWEGHGADIMLIITTVWTNLTTVIIPGLLTGLLTFVGWVWGGIQKVIEGVLNFIGTIIDLWAAYIKGGWEGFWTALKDKLSIVGQEIQDKAAELWDKIKVKLQEFWDDVKIKWDVFWTGLKDFVAGKVDEFVAAAASIIKGITDAISAWFLEQKTNWEVFWQGLIDWINGLWQGFYNAGAYIIQGIIDGINSVINKLRTLVGSLGADLPDWLKKLLGITSPSKVFMEIGVNMMKGLAKGIQVGTVIPTGAMKAAAVNVAKPIYQRGAITNNNNVNMNMGGFNVNNGMDVAMIKTIIRQTVAEAVGGAG